MKPVPTYNAAMSNYRRFRMPGGTYFFTVNLLERRRDWLVRHIDALRDAVRRTKQQRPFHIDAWVVLPDHLHCVWTLPPGITIFPIAGKLSRSALFNPCPAQNGDPPFVSPRANGAYGNAGFGNTPFATTKNTFDDSHGFVRTMRRNAQKAGFRPTRWHATDVYGIGAWCLDRPET